jgi:hypothetical protein
MWMTHPGLRPLGGPDGQHRQAGHQGLDTGCVWGNSLTLWRYEDDALIATPVPLTPSDEECV